MAKHILFASVPLPEDLDIRRITDVADTIVAKYGGRLSGSGCGFGMRDMDWMFDDQPPQAVLDELKAAFPDVEAFVEPDEQDNEP